MALKFCSGLFPSEAPTTSGPSPASAAQVDAKNALKKKALDAILLDAQDAKWEKEFRVFFDGTRATGLGFQCAVGGSAGRSRAPSATNTPGASFTTISRDGLGPNSNNVEPEEEHAELLYACIVKEISPQSLAAEYNARCRSVGDYSRLIREHLRVRKVNSDDVTGLSYELVLQKMRAAMPAFFLTFADISSKRVAASKGAISLQAPSLRRRQSSMLIATGGPPVITLRNSSIGLSTPLGGGGLLETYLNTTSEFPQSQSVRLTARRNSSSSVVFLHGGGLGGNSTADNATSSAALLVGDLEAKAKDVGDQLCAVKQQMAQLQREKDQVALENERMIQERDAIAAAKRQLEAERLKLCEERDTMVAKNRLLASQRQSASDLLVTTVEQEQREASKLKSELDAARDEIAQLQLEHTHLLGSHATLQGKMVDQVRLCDETSQLVEDLRHEKEELSLMWKELQLEHSDASHHAEELHSRLVGAQSQQKAAEKQLELFNQELDHKAAQLRVLKQGLEAALSHSSAELDHLMLLQGGPGDESSAEVIEHLGFLKYLREEHVVLEKHRDELLVESSRFEQAIETYEHEIEELSLKNGELRDKISSLQSEIEAAHHRQQLLQSDFESKHLDAQQSSSSTHEELQRQIQLLEKRCESEKQEKEQLRAALDRLEDSARARLEAHNRDQEFLAQFKQQLVNGVVVTKYGSRGNPHARVLFSDFACRWISWKPPSSTVSLASPRVDAKVETGDLVEVIPGATTEVFLRQKPDTPAKCLSLVFVHPCRTLDIEADTAEKCQFFLRGFRLLLEEVSHKRRQ